MYEGVTTIEGPATMQREVAPDTDQPSSGVTHVVAFARMIDDKDDGVYMQGIYFGGVASGYDEARQIARDCVNNVRGGVIIPKIIPTTDKPIVMSAMQEAARRFTDLEYQMIQAEDIIERTSKRPRR